MSTYSSEGSSGLTVMSSGGHNHSLEMAGGGLSNSGRSRDTEQVNICPHRQAIAVRAVVEVQGGAGGGGGRGGGCRCSNTLSRGLCSEKKRTNSDDREIRDEKHIAAATHVRLASHSKVTTRVKWRECEDA